MMMSGSEYSNEDLRIRVVKTGTNKILRIECGIGRMRIREVKAV
jgi:hypothetical protein